MGKFSIKKAAALLAASAVMLTAAHFPMKQPRFEADAASKARVSVHDPSIIKNGSTYYVFGSHIEAAKTTDLQSWTRFTNGYTTPGNVEFGDLSQNLQKAFAWAGEDLEDCANGFAVWAPDVFYNPDYINPDGTKGAYLMYFCTSSTYMRSVIAYAASKNIEGPYTFVDTLIYSGFTNNDSYATSQTKNVNRKYTSTNVDELIASGEVTFNNSWFNKNNYNNQLFPNAIDPTIYTGADGRLYMCYGSWSGGIFSLEIDKATGKCIHPKSGTTSDGRMIDSYFGTKISGGYGKSGEGPFIEYNADTGYYYLWVTYGALTSTGGYNMRVFRSKEPTGPFTDPAGRQAVLPTKPDLDSVGLKVMGNYKFSSLSTAYMACGHNSVLRDDDGKWFLFYHTRFDDGAEFHEVRVHQMFFNEEGWPVTAPFEYSGDTISPGGYNESDIIGDYEYINHGNSTDGNIISYQNISLNADHTISGDVTGLWEEEAGTANVIFIIGKQRYYGVFTAAENEKGIKVMSFTAAGSNNQSIWGAKNTEFTGSERSANADYTDKNAELVMNKDTVGEPSKSLRLSGTDLLSGVPYYITNVNSGLAVDLPNGKLDNGTNIQQWNENQLWAQQWKIISVDDEWCRIVSVGDEAKCIAVAEDSAADAVNVELQTYSGAANQLFKIVKSGIYYGIVSKCSEGKGALDVFEWSKENGGNINQYAYHEYNCQLWNITPVHPAIPYGEYTIRNVNSGLYVGMDTRNSLVQTTKPQKWMISGNTGSERSISVDTHGVLPILPVNAAVVDNSSENGADIAYMSIDEEGPDLFRFICNKDGSYSILTASSDYKSCFDVYEMSKEEGANICQWEFWGGDGQKFVFEPVEAGSDLGDVNADGEVGIADIIELENYLLGRTNDLGDWKLGDMNSDDRITAADDILLRRTIFNR